MERTISAVEATLVVGACMMMGFTAMVIERVAMEEASIICRVGGRDAAKFERNSQEVSWK